MKDDFFIDQGLDFRPILSQIVSSELDADRMDYLERDSYFSGTNYGKIDLDWLIAHMKFAIVDKKLYLALNRRALYTFDDFMLSRHHIHLMVYFHHKPIIYEEMLNLYLLSDDCDFSLPADIGEYVRYNDFRLYEHLAGSRNEWAQRISQRRPYQRLIELHNTGDSSRSKKIIKFLDSNDIHNIWSSSQARLSKYHAGPAEDRPNQIYVVDQFDRLDKPTPIDRSTEIFQKYEGTRIIDRIYVAPENFRRAEKILAEAKI
jgi:HD superfamily phosphohydrolase